MRTLVVTIAALCALVVAGCGGSSGEHSATPGATRAENDSPQDPSRERAPAIEGASLDGDPISLTDYRGRPVLINVWSSW